MNPSSREKRHHLGQHLAFALHQVVRSAAEGSLHEAFGAPLVQLCAAMTELIASDGVFALELEGDALCVNRQPVRFDGEHAPLPSALHRELSSRGLHGLCASELPPVEELRALFDLFTPEAGATPELPQLPTLKLRGAPPVTATEPARAQGTRLAGAYAQAAFFVVRYLELLRAGKQVPQPRVASGVVRELVDLSAQAPLRFLQLARTKASGEAYWAHHAANVAVLSIAFGARLGLHRARLHDLGMTALLHDVGMAALPASLVNKPESLEQKEQAAVAASPLFAARAILREGEVHPAALDRAQGALECHLDRPAGLIGRVVGICEAYDSLTTARPWRAAHGSAAALQVMKTALSKKLDPQLLPLFVQVAQHLE